MTAPRFKKLEEIDSGVAGSDEVGSFGLVLASEDVTETEVWDTDWNCDRTCAKDVETGLAGVAGSCTDEDAAF